VGDIASNHTWRLENMEESFNNGNIGGGHAGVQGGVAGRGGARDRNQGAGEP